MKKLKLDQYEIEDDTLELLFKDGAGAFPMLDLLSLSETLISESSLTLLLECDFLEQLKTLHFDGLEKIKSQHWEEFFDGITEKKNLKLNELSVEFCNITNSCLIKLEQAEWIHKLTKLSLAGCKLIGIEGLQALERIHNKNQIFTMTDIYLDFRQFFYEDQPNHYILTAEPQMVQDNLVWSYFRSYDKTFTRSELKERKKFKTLIRDNVMENIVEKKPFSKLIYLDLKQCSISNLSLQYIANSVNSQKLQTIDLTDTIIDDEGLQFLSNSINLFNVKNLILHDCYNITGKGLKYIFDSQFSKQFNPDAILTEFAGELTTEILAELIKNKRFIQNMKSINLTQMQDQSLEDLDHIFVMESYNPKLLIECNIQQIIEQFKSDFDDELLEKIAASNVISKLRKLSLGGAKITKEGIEKIILSEKINPKFQIQPLINDFDQEIDDSILNAISRSKFFHNINEIDLSNCQYITNIGILNIVQTNNENFNIQKIIEDHGGILDSLFVKNIIQQSYISSDNLLKLKLSTCEKFNTQDLILITRAVSENFQIEKLIKDKYLPGENTNLVTNELLKEIVRSAPFIKQFELENEEGENRKYFNFDIRKYRMVDYGINYLIEKNVAKTTDYDDYLSHFSSYLSFESLQKIVELCKNGEQSVLEQLQHVTRLDFSLNKNIYNKQIKDKIFYAIDNWSDSSNLNFDRETIDVFSAFILKTEISNDASYLNEDEKDKVVVDLIQFLPNLEELNLNNQDVSDYFLKQFSKLLESNNQNYLASLERIKLRNNFKITQIGLKYLYCTRISNNVIKVIDVSAKQKDEPASTYFINYGLYGLIEWYIDYYYRETAKSFKQGCLQTVMDWRFFFYLIVFILCLPILVFHYIQMILRNLPIYFGQTRIAKAFGKFFMEQEYEEELPENQSLEQSMISSSSRIHPRRSKVRRCLRACFCCVLYFLRKKTHKKKKLNSKALQQQINAIEKSLQISKKKSYYGDDHKSDTSKQQSYLNAKSSDQMSEQNDNNSEILNFDQQQEEVEEDDELFIRKSLKIRYKYITEAQKLMLEAKRYGWVRRQLRFYFDESFIALNGILSGKWNKKRNIKQIEQVGVTDTLQRKYTISETMAVQYIKLQDGDNTSYQDKLKSFFRTKNSFFLSKLRWILLLNFLIQYTITLGYQIATYRRCSTSTDDDEDENFIFQKINENSYQGQVLRQGPYFIYALLSLLMEAFLLYECSKIIQNKIVFNPFSLQIIGNLLSSQISKYDVFTDINFVIDNKNCNNNEVFYISMSIMSVSLVINFCFILDFFWNIFTKKLKRVHSSAFINKYSKISISMDLYALGKSLDKFSTSSSTKFSSWYIPQKIKNIYIPLIIIETFRRLLLEDLPQITLQIYSLVGHNVSLSNFGTLMTFVTSIANLLLVLHQAWNVKSSFFDRELFAIYDLVLVSQQAEDDEENEDDDDNDENDDEKQSVTNPSQNKNDVDRSSNHNVDQRLNEIPIKGQKVVFQDEFDED